MAASRLPAPRYFSANSQSVKGSKFVVDVFLFPSPVFLLFIPVVSTASVYTFALYFAVFVRVQGRSNVMIRLLYVFLFFPVVFLLRAGSVLINWYVRVINAVAMLVCKKSNLKKY